MPNRIEILRNVPYLKSLIQFERLRTSLIERPRYEDAVEDLEYYKEQVIKELDKRVMQLRMKDPLKFMNEEELRKEVRLKLEHCYVDSEAAVELVRSRCQSVANRTGIGVECLVAIQGGKKVERIFVKPYVNPELIG